MVIRGTGASSRVKAGLRVEGSLLIEMKSSLLEASCVAGVDIALGMVERDWGGSVC